MGAATILQHVAKHSAPKSPRPEPPTAVGLYVVLLVLLVHLYHIRCLLACGGETGSEEGAGSGRVAATQAPRAGSSVWSPGSVTANWAATPVPFCGAFVFAHNDSRSAHRLSAFQWSLSVFLSESPCFHYSMASSYTSLTHFKDFMFLSDFFFLTFVLINSIKTLLHTSMITDVVVPRGALEKSAILSFTCINQKQKTTIVISSTSESSSQLEATNQGTKG